MRIYYASDREGLEDQKDYKEQDKWEMRKYLEQPEVRVPELYLEVSEQTTEVTLYQIISLGRVVSDLLVVNISALITNVTTSLSWTKTIVLESWGRGVNIIIVFTSASQ